MLCDEFEWERQRLLGRIGNIEGSNMWLEEFMEKDHVGKMVILLDRRIVGLAAWQERNVMAAVIECWAEL